MAKKVHITIEQALNWFEDAYKSHRHPEDTKDNFYCGITNDPERRKGSDEHNVESYLVLLECQDGDTAKDLERMLNDAHFNVGNEAGHGTDESVFVYMYRRIPGVTKP